MVGALASFWQSGSSSYFSPDLLEVPPSTSKARLVRSPLLGCSWFRDFLPVGADRDLVSRDLALAHESFLGSEGVMAFSLP